MDEYTLKEFLETISPGKSVCVKDTFLLPNNARVFMPIIQLYCHHTNCDGMRYFRSKYSVRGEQSSVLLQSKNNDVFLSYVCKNCGETFKVFAVKFTYDDEIATWLAYKYGENPSFGPPTSAKFIKLIGPDRDLFLAERRSENQGLGIGAFGYYRRVVENQKN